MQIIKNDLSGSLPNDSIIEFILRENVLEITVHTAGNPV